MQVQSTLTRSPAAAESTTLLRRYAATREPRDLDELVRRFAPLVRKLAQRYAHRGESLDDLVQVGSIGLVKALQGFDPDRGYAFSSFAVPTILGEIKRSFRNTGWAVHVPRAIQERVAEVRRASDALQSELGRTPSVRQIAGWVGCDEELVIEALEAGDARDAISLDKPARKDGEEGMLLLDLLASLDAGYDETEDRDAIRVALPSLTPREREMLRLRFEEDLKQSEIAERMGCSQMQVSRVVRASLERLSRVARRQSGLAA